MFVLFGVSVFVYFPFVVFSTIVRFVIVSTLFLIFHDVFFSICFRFKCFFVYFNVYLLATSLDTLGAPNEFENDSRNRLRNGPEMTPKPDPQGGEKGRPK